MLGNLRLLTLDNGIAVACVIGALNRRIGKRVNSCVDRLVSSITEPMVGNE